jgi:long-subunit fatty acid transport protein
MSYTLKGMLTACLFYPLLLNAQSEIDALRYSQQIFGSTARSMSMGGAFGALGADFSSLSSNPAGIGIYRKSEFTFSMGFANRNTESEFQNNSGSKNRFSFDIPDLGMVFAFPKSENSNKFRFGFALGYNRTANFNSESTYTGKNTDNSLLDSFIEDIRQYGGATSEDLYYDFAFDADLAYQTYLLNPDTININQYVSVIPDGEAYQSQNTSTWGGMGEFSLGMGFNFSDMFSFGFSFGFPTIHYEEESIYEENDIDREISVADTLNFKSFRYDQFLNTTGNGFNANFGIIVKPVNWLRVGAAIHSPTYYYMHDNYRSAMYSSFEGGASYGYLSPDGAYSYNLTTPFKAIGSLAFIFGKHGLISFDYELTDYSMSNFDASDYSFSNENKIINEVYKNTASNFRGGLEIKYEKFAFRAGGAYYSSPINSEYTTSETDQHVISFTGGIGYRQKRFFIDIGYGYFRRSEAFSAYTLVQEQVPSATMSRTDNRVVTTFGIRF